MSYDFLNMWLFLSLVVILMLLIEKSVTKKENKALEKEIENVRKAWNDERLELYNRLGKK